MVSLILLSKCILQDYGASGVVIHHNLLHGVSVITSLLKKHS